jgi:hypothetical protein
VLVVKQVWTEGDPTASENPGRFVRPRGNSTLPQARAFRGFPLYFAGERAAGHRLEAVLRFDRTAPAPHTEFSFLYGGCRSIGGQGCRPPLEILVWPACYRYETRYSIRPEERTVVRGVPARRSHTFRRLELYPAGTTIVINGDGLRRRTQLLEVARELRGVNVPLRPDARLLARPRHAGQTIKCG